MTTIAYKAGVLAADTQLTTASGMRDGCMTKVAKRGPILAAASGPAGQVRTFLDWLRSGLIGDAPRVDDSFEGYIFASDVVICLDEGGLHTLRQETFTAGSGGRIAAGAMEAGASAEEAVRIAATRDCYTGGDITVLRH